MTHNFFTQHDSISEAAHEILTDELMRLDEQHTQTVISPRIFTNSNMTNRYGYGVIVGGTIASVALPSIVTEEDVNILTEG